MHPKQENSRNQLDGNAKNEKGGPPIIPESVSSTKATDKNGKHQKSKKSHFRRVPGHIKKGQRRRSPYGCRKPMIIAPRSLRQQTR